MRIAFYSELKPLFLVIGAVVFSLGPTSCNTQEASSGTRLFQKDADTWFEEGDAIWTFDDDELIGNSESGNGFVMTKDTYKNFVLELEFHPDDTINSGVFIRCGGHLINGETCYEINIWDKRPEQDYRTASIVGFAEPLAYIETMGRWNSYKIQCEGDHLQVWLNDTLTVDHHDSSFIEGHIGLQAHGKGEITFRNVKITSL
jgi:hypothetical protein